MKNHEVFDSTIPFGEPELLRASAYHRYLHDLDADAARHGAGRRQSSLSPSLQADLHRFEEQAGGAELLEVVAACLRHAKPVTIQLQCGEHVVPLSVFAHERLVHCPMDLTELVEKHLVTLRVIHVEPADANGPADAEHGSTCEPPTHHPIAPLLWQLALRSARRELLPQIAGPAVYRVAPGLADDMLPVRGASLATVQRLRSHAASLRELSERPGMGRERASRLLNALYLQAGLIVSRSHPDAVRDGWFGSA